jgi:hypothetical protein
LDGNGFRVAEHLAVLQSARANECTVTTSIETNPKMYKKKKKKWETDFFFGRPASQPPMTTTRFSIDVIGFDAKQTSDLLVGSSKMFSNLMQEMLPEIESVESNTASVKQPGVLTRNVDYELNPMVWEPLHKVLQVAAPGLIHYTDTLTYLADRPGWDFVTEWAGVPGISPSCVKVSGGARIADDGPFGAVITYEMHIKCTLPLVGGLVERTVAQGFQKTCEQIPKVIQKYYVMWNDAQTEALTASF